MRTYDCVNICQWRQQLIIDHNSTAALSGVRGRKQGYVVGPDTTGSCDKTIKLSPDHEDVEGTNRRIQSALFLNRKCIFKTLTTWLMDVNNLDFTPFTTEKSKIHCICCRCFVGRYELQHYRSSAVQLWAFLWACPFKIMLQ